MSFETIAVIFGASKYPKRPAFDNEVFAKSASAIAEYVAAPAPLGLGAACLNLYNAPEGRDDFFKKTAAFFTEHKAAKQVVIYYIGHGLPLKSELHLAIAATDAVPSISSIRAGDLRDNIQAHFAKRRVFLVLDCCFAAAAVKEFMTHGAAHYASRRAAANWPGATPKQGVAVLAAAPSDDVARARPGAAHTVFTGALLEVLRSGVDHGGDALSLDDLCTAVRERLDEMNDANALPEVYAPGQKHGNLASFPLFPNRRTAPIRSQLRTEPKHLRVSQVLGTTTTMQSVRVFSDESPLTTFVAEASGEHLRVEQVAGSLVLHLAAKKLGVHRSTVTISGDPARYLPTVLVVDSEVSAPPAPMDHPAVQVDGEVADWKPSSKMSPQRMGLIAGCLVVAIGVVRCAADSLKQVEDVPPRSSAAPTQTTKTTTQPPVTAIQTTPTPVVTEKNGGTGTVTFVAACTVPPKLKIVLNSKTAILQVPNIVDAGPATWTISATGWPAKDHQARVEPGETKNIDVCKGH